MDALEALHPEPFSGTVWRTTWATRSPLMGSTAGGRWHPENSFEALYTSTETDGSLPEVYFNLSRAPVFSSAHVRLYQLRVPTRRTLRLEPEVLGRRGIEAAKYAAMDYARSREIGAAAHFLEFDSLLVPSPRWPCLNLLLFLDWLDPDSLTIGEAQEVNWRRGGSRTGALERARSPRPAARPRITPPAPTAARFRSCCRCGR